MNSACPVLIIHAGKYLLPTKNWKILLLKKISPERYLWFRFIENQEDEEMGIEASSIPEALQHAHTQWKHLSFRLIHCGFLYTLPERDEHGINALFHQMATSYLSPNGVFFEEDLGHMCHVQNASKEALNLLKNLGRVVTR